jgi:mRNA interferase MazF
MPPTTGFSFGDIVLVPFPFTDQSAVKRRPAVVISSGRYNQARPDVIIMAITSQSRTAGSSSDLQVNAWKEAGLLKPSAVKPIATTIEQSLVVRKLGRLSEMDQAALRRTLSNIIG